MKYFLLAILCISLSFCGDSGIYDCPSDAGVTFHYPDNTIQTYNNIIFKIDSVTNSICPCTADCLWMGEIVFHLSINDSAKPVEYYDIHSYRSEENPSHIGICDMTLTSECYPELEYAQLAIDVDQYN